MKTFDQCKDEVAKKYDYINWAHFSTDYYAYQEKVLSWLDEAAELYAQEVAKDAWDRACEAMVKSESVESISLKIQQLAADLINAGQKPYIASPIYVRYMRTVIESFEQELSICRIKPPYQPNQEKP